VKIRVRNDRKGYYSTPKGPIGPQKWPARHERAEGPEEGARSRAKVIKTLDKSPFQSIESTLRIDRGFGKEREGLARIFSCG
jgi:hypothetical protein